MEVDLARVHLCAHGDALTFEAHLGADLMIEILDLSVVAFEEFEECGLGSDGTLDATYGKVVQFMGNALVIQQQVLLHSPQRASLSHGSELRGLLVRESQHGHVCVG